MSRAIFASSRKRSTSGGGGGQGRDQSCDGSLANVEEFSGGRFNGANGESFNSWGKNAEIYLKIKQEGFKMTLETIEDDEETPLDECTLANLRLSNTEPWGDEHRNVGSYI